MSERERESSFVKFTKRCVSLLCNDWCNLILYTTSIHFIPNRMSVVSYPTHFLKVTGSTHFVEVGWVRN